MLNHFCCCFVSRHFFSRWLYFPIRWFWNFLLQKVAGKKWKRAAESWTISKYYSHLSCFEKWLKIFCEAFGWLSPSLILVWELSEAKTVYIHLNWSLSRIMPMGKSYHWNGNTFIRNTNRARMMAIRWAALIQNLLFSSRCACGKGKCRKLKSFHSSKKKRRESIRINCQTISTMKPSTNHRIWR